MRVLIVEDDRDNAKSLAGFLALNARWASISLTARDALDKIKGGLRPNCVLLNPHTADGNGIKLLSALTEWYARQGVSPPPIVGMTGLKRPSNWPPELPMLLKPLDSAQVLVELDRVRTPSSVNIPMKGDQP